MRILSAKSPLQEILDHDETFRLFCSAAGESQGGWEHGPSPRRPRTGRILGRSRARFALLAAGVHAVHGHERGAGRPRMVTLRVPGRRDAPGGPAVPAPEFARRRRLTANRAA